MTTRLDLVLRKHPEHEEGIRLLAARDPSRNLKYIDWGVKVLASGQALAPEIAEVLDLFHRFNGRWFGRRREKVRGDIYTYRPQDLASLRDGLLKIKRAQDQKRRKRERLYKIEGAIETDIVYDSDDLIVRHIKNKQASVHYGLGTKWCISMLREGYFEDYETHNATFFFFERKGPRGDEFDKVALMVPRLHDSRRTGESAQAFTALDLGVDMMTLAQVYGARVFDIFRDIHERSERYPASAMFQIYSGNATEEQLQAAFANVKGGAHETGSTLQSICCNDAAPGSLLEEIARRAAALLERDARRYHRRSGAQELIRDVMAAVAIHPNTPAGVREKLTKWLRRRRVDVDTIRRVWTHGRVGVEYETTGGKTRGRRRGYLSVKELRVRAGMFDRLAVRTRRKARTLQRKLTAAKKKKKRRAAAWARRTRAAPVRA